ncbi:hypothetical protein PSI23_20470 [Xenorhabdus sp. XENO-10]|uniref:Uncharacterized protein n=1 Tax=Xenorhabdus yunnanensis TaxID=3025878 RepID=A0ABT5LM27_9GAMM|nr:hypothetical protein [Xenorhabdus yunnanensis]MDC9591588.1 hypothetical protein [Xenorhabdus yunnanensis]
MTANNHITFSQVERHKHIVKAFSELSAVLPENHELKWLLAILSDNLKVIFDEVNDHLFALADQDIL